MSLPSKSTEFSLMQKQVAQKALMAKMRTRLAGGSEYTAKIIESQKVKTHKSRFSLGVKLGMAGIIILGNLAYLGYRHETKGIAIARHAQVLPAPSSVLSLDDQALYWTYALYDYNLLKTRFGVPKGVVVDAAHASAKIKELMPKIDARTQFIIKSYQPQGKKNS